MLSLRGTSIGRKAIKNEIKIPKPFMTCQRINLQALTSRRSKERKKNDFTYFQVVHYFKKKSIL